MPASPHRRLLLAIVLSVTLVTTAVVVAIVGSVVVVMRADGPVTVEQAAVPPTFVPTTVRPTAPAPALTPRSVPPTPNLFVATTSDGRLVVSIGGTRTSADIGAPAPRLALTPDARAVVVERSNASPPAPRSHPTRGSRR